MAVPTLQEDCLPASSNAAQRHAASSRVPGADEPSSASDNFESTAIVTPGTAGSPRYVEGSVVAQKYRLVRVLGEGGMGAVWVAQNLTLGVQVALKLIRAEIEGRVDGLSERLLQEARAAAAIGHPAIIQVFDFGVTEHSEPFIAMELLHGESLAQVLKRRGRLAAGRAARTLLPVIEALVVAHQRGIVHRDLKPDNIFLAQQANRVQPKVLDFGIAKLSQSFSANLTSEGTVLGSPAYMSPEQARGESNVDLRTDMWALCVVLYEMLTGQHPFTGTNWHGLMWAIMQNEPKPLREHGIEEPGLQAILSRGLMKDREARYETLFELGQALAIWLIEQGVTRDICNSSLKTSWLDRSPNSAPGGLNSFFPSDAPQSDAEQQQQPPEPAEPGATPAPLEQGVVSAARSRIRRSLGTRAASVTPGGASRNWLIITALGAALSFSIALGYSLLSQGQAGSASAADDDEPAEAIRVREPSRNLAIAPRRDLTRHGMPISSTPLSEDVEALKEARELAKLGPAKKASKPARPAAKKPAADLKDPFAERAGRE